MQATSPFVIGIAAYVAIKTIYRLYFHQLARFPGPKLAAATHWYEGYIEVVQKRPYGEEIDRMHKKYGKLTLCSQFLVIGHANLLRHRPNRQN